MSAPAQYRLVIFEPIDEPREARDLVCRVTGMHPTDAAQWLGRMPGTWPRPLDEPTVRALLDGLYELRIAAEARRVDLFPDLAPARSVHRAACLDEGLRIEGLRGEPTHWIPWDRVELICAARIRAGEEVRDVQPPRWPSTMVAGIRALALLRPKPTSRLARATRSPRDPVGEAVIVRRDPRIAFRIVENQMNYAYLGDRLRPSASENFPIFLADLCGRASAAYIAPSTWALLGREAADEPLFPSSQALLDYATHRLLWSWYSRDRDRNHDRQRDGSGPGRDRDRDARRSGTGVDTEFDEQESTDPGPEWDHGRESGHGPDESPGPSAPDGPP